ncbi:hypothetical protein VOLCADRAFT_91127 [Volvox carteri f. nagariensis]|uniref:3'-5' exonuclease domain-containing protein n=1 Tax=Volvox carteri f. nagariensis TaxID=3068 RepID=D8TW90_VOLCA|nr:uncharacterized protein VOLCADRAFT_91127 [Volvox carteri f. nagariensis]EFJ48433.1 hypothetical protein VOLCADRAFT_91127 [Volvox carteri f. nagariensis]|eukprot:XP_002950687.1 hypothetical protein VOLCADRAFT_91127 [Volvox carteri f. nagariensis]
MLARQVHSAHSSVHHLWVDRTQSVVPLTAQTCCPRRYHAPTLALTSRTGTCGGGSGSRASKAGPNEPQATPEATSNAPLGTPRGSSSQPLADRAHSPTQTDSSGVGEVSVAPQLASAALWQPSVTDPPRREELSVGAGGGRGADRPLLVSEAATATTAAAGCSSAAPEPGQHGGAREKQQQQSRRIRESSKSSEPVHVEAQSSSAPSLPQAAGSWEIMEHDNAQQTSSVLGGIGPGNWETDATGDGGAGTDATADVFGLPLWLDGASASSLDSLVPASVTAVDEGKLEEIDWEQLDFERAWPRTFDLSTVYSAASATTPGSSSGGSSFRRRRRGSGGDCLDDDEDMWEFGAYMYDEHSDNGVSGAPAAARRYQDANLFASHAQSFSGGLARRGGGGGSGIATANDTGNGGDIWPQRRGRDRRGRAIGRRWQDTWDDWDGPGGGQLGDWGRTWAAVSTRLPRVGLSVAFPLPPAGCAATEDKTAAAADSEPPPLVLAAKQSAAVKSPGTADTPAPPPATSPKVAKPNWATVTLSYNFGSSFKLLEEKAVTREVPLPEELLLLAGRPPDSGAGGGGGGGGGGRSAVDALLPGCTAYTIAGDYHVLLVQDGRSLAPAVAWFRASLGEDRVVGIDSEWPPTFKTGEAPQLAMLQLATSSRVLLLHIARMRRKEVIAPGGPIHVLLSDPSLTWVGSGWSNSDRTIVKGAFGGATLPPAVVDVQVAARAAGWGRVGLLALVNDLLGMREFQKPRKLSMCNWAAASLSERQARLWWWERRGPGGRRMHAPKEHAAMPSGPPNVLAQAVSVRSAVCEHCGRTVQLSDKGNAAGSDNDGGGVAAAAAKMAVVAAATKSSARGADPRVKASTGPAARPTSKSGSLRTYLQGVVDGMQLQKTSELPGRRSRRLLFVPDLDPSSDTDSKPGSDEDSGLASGIASNRDSGSGSTLGEGGDRGGEPLSPSPAAEAVVVGKSKSKSKRKKKRAAQPVAVSGASSPSSSSPSSSRQQALWDAFEDASPAAAAAVALVMSGQENSRSCTEAAG